MTARGCAHLQSFKDNATNMDTIRSIYTVFVVGSPTRHCKKKICNAFCQTCQNRGPYLHACLECVYFGCQKHIREHTKEEHNFSMELNYGQIHCTICGDYIYDSELDNILMKNNMQCGTFRQRLFKCISSEPTDEERKLLSNKTKKIRITPISNLLSNKTKKIRITPRSTIGLRGLINLGATCYMNCIVQALMHTPLLRDYFLTERHYCKRISGTCLVCEFFKLFQDYNSGDKGPLVLHRLLYLLWTNANHLGGYEKPDAQEFFITTLCVLHEHLSESMSRWTHIINQNNGGNCSCIAHQIFSGRLQSDLVCQKCNGVSTVFEPIWDFSLDLGPITGGSRSPSSLIHCLERFTKAEHLGSNQKIMCENCGSKQEGTKQFTIRTLPIVISFHLKRFQFQHFGFEAVEPKISTAISFPEMLDMTPFMSKGTKDSPFSTDNRYSLFAVINHSGNSINSGHYTAFVRQQHDYWYKCNDEHISRANLKEVLDSEGYILFYHKHIKM